MIVVHTIADLNNVLDPLRSTKSIGFVPTMGALHEGHLFLIKTANENTDISVCSIFVNPTQFNNAHDLAVYPRTLDADCKLLEKTNCDIVFAPEANEMYTMPHEIKFDFGSLEHVMEGKFRPGHFNGVGIVVSKLFNIVRPNKAYFGQKDFQQCAVIRRLIIDLSFQIEFIVCETMREKSGLAMSSRNKNLSIEQMETAPILYKCLCQAKEKLEAGRPLSLIKNELEQVLKDTSGIELEYFEIANRLTLNTLDIFEPGNTVICIAVFMGKTRLIDNVVA